MTIHTSAKFQESGFNWHSEFSVNISVPEIEANKGKLANLAVAKFKEKCIERFKMDFNKMTSFEVYYYSGENEIEIFKKVKE